MSLFDDLPHSVSIHAENISTETTSGGQPTSFTLRAAGVPCLIAAGSGSERDEFGQSQRPVATHTIAFAGDNDGGVQPGDKLVDDNTGKTYRFTGDRPQQGVGGIDAWQLITVREVN